MLKKCSLLGKGACVWGEGNWVTINVWDLWFTILMLIMVNGKEQLGKQGSSVGSVLAVVPRDPGSNFSVSVTEFETWFVEWFLGCCECIFKVSTIFIYFGLQSFSIQFLNITETFSRYYFAIFFWFIFLGGSSKSKNVLTQQKNTFARKCLHQNV